MTSWAGVLACVLVSMFSVSSTYEPAEQLLVKTNEKGISQCWDAENLLPKTLPALRKIAALQREDAKPSSQFCFDAKQRCSEHMLQFEGLTASVIGVSGSKRVELLDLTVTGQKWNLFAVQIGQSVRDVERVFEVRIPRGATTAALGATCSPLIIDFEHGMVARLHASCSACI